MDEKEVENLVKEAEENRAKDQEVKAAVESRNLADSLTYQAEKTLTDNADKIDDAEKKDAEEKIAELKKVLENAEATKEEIDTASEPLSKVMMEIGQKIYAAEAPAEGEDDGVNVKHADDADEETVEAEVEEEK